MLPNMAVRHEMRDQTSSLDRLIKKLRSKIKSKHIIVTQGRFGSTHFVENKKYYCPAFSDSAIDSTGAGDTFFSLASLGLSAKINYKLMNLISSIASGYSVNNFSVRGFDIEYGRIFTEKENLARKKYTKTCGNNK